MQKQLQLQLHKELQKEDLNDTFDYIQPFRTPIVLYGKLLDKNTMSILGYSYGKQRNVFYGDYMIEEDTLIIHNGCKNVNILQLMKDVVKTRTEDGYVLLSTTSSNKTFMHNPLTTSIINKTSYLFLNYEHIIIYLDILYDRIGYKRGIDLEKDKEIEIQLIGMLHNNILYAITLYYIYNDNSYPSTVIKQFPDLNKLKLNLNYKVSYIVKLVNDTFQKTNYDDFYQMDGVGSIDTNLLICLDLAMNLNNAVNLSDTRYYKEITNKIIDHLAKRSFINKDITIVCPTLSYCKDNYNENELCNIYTNFNL